MITPHCARRGCICDAVWKVGEMLSVAVHRKFDHTAKIIFGSVS